MIIGKCENAKRQEMINLSLFEYVHSYIAKIMEQINYTLEYKVYAIFFDDETHTSFNHNNAHFPKKWFEILPSCLDNNSEIEKAVDSATTTALQEYQNNYNKEDSFFNDKITSEFQQKFFLKLATNVFREKDKNDEQCIMISSPLSSSKYKIECWGSLLDDIDDNCVLIVKFTMLKEMQILRDLLNKHLKFFTGLMPSFFESCIDELFNSFIDGIYKKRLDDNHEVEVDNIIALAGKKFLWTISMLLGGDLDNSEITPKDHSSMYMIEHKHKKLLSHNIEKISALAYEKNEAFGKFLFMPKVLLEKSLKHAIITFETPYELSEHKLIRKLLEIVSTDYCILSTTRNVYGIIKKSKIQDIIENDILEYIFEVNIEKGRVWHLSYVSKTEHYFLLKSEYGNYTYIKPRVDYNEFENALSKVFSFHTKQIEPLKQIVQQALEQTHGTMIVFSKSAESEVRRLHRCCIPVSKINLSDCSNKEVIKFITSIDGAVLCDGQGNCHAIGVILDGKTSEKHENISRGARYNSAHRYHSTQEKNCVIVIISEDKDITIV